MKRVLVAIVLALAAAPALAQSPYDAPGPYTVKNKVEGPGCHVFRPTDLAGKPHPVILWGNGTNTMVAIYSPMLRQWASHGFIVAAALTGSAGTGREMLACLDYLAKENARDGSIYKGAVDMTHVGASGHSQGGTGTIMAGRDPRIVATAPIQPYTLGARYEAGAEQKQHGPMLLLSGGADTIADPIRNQKPIYDKANVPVVWATLLPAGHNAPATADSGPYRPAITAWFLWQLAGDETAAEMFRSRQCGYCASDAWSVEKRGVE